MIRGFFVLLTFCFTHFLTVNSAYNSTAPTWLPSPYFRAGNNRVINTKTSNGVQTYYTFTFSSALSGIPNLAYGVKNYRGMDTMLTQSFEILRRNLTSSLFTVSIEIFGITNIFQLTVPYLAIDPQFPHHLNSFDNVPINYTYGPLTNFSGKFNYVATFTNTLNYTQQAAANKYKTFTEPLSSNKIVLFLTSFEINGTTGTPMDFSVVITILNSSHYRWTVTIDRSAYVGKVHFSQIIYNEDDVTASKTYAIVYYDWTAYVASNYSFTAFPAELTDNMITALVDFNATSGNCGVEYNWQFVSNFSGNNYVIYQNVSYPSKTGNFTSSATCGFNRTRSTVFYIKTWKCGPPYIYFNITTDLCQNGCADYFYENTTSATCETCYYNCIDCIKPNDSTACSACQSGFNRTLTNGSCTCNSGYFDDWNSLPCRSCSTVDSNCLTCTYAYNSSKTITDYKTIFANTSWPTNIKPDYKCTLCKSTHFINSSNLCQLCTLSYCLTCINGTACQTCNSSASATKSTDNLCYLCTVPNCVSCSGTNVCASCGTGYFVLSGACQTCSSSCTCDGWIMPMVNGACSTLCGDGFKVGNQQCDDNNTIDHDGCSSTCTIEPCNLNCSCDGWIQPWVNTNNSCTTLCGDGMKKGIQQCDDGNLIDHDGCSSICRIEPCNLNCSCDGWVSPWVNSNNSCTTVCGDGFKRGIQQCDDGNLNDHDGCSVTCTIEPCNVSCLCDGWIQPWVSFNSSCSSLCGDSFKRGNQACDDGNLNNHDGCSSTCKLQTCDISCLCDGWTQPWLNVNASCTSICGDSLIRGNEQCDDGNSDNHDGCSSTCMIQSCDQNCSCDGWMKPWAGRLCTPICGDTILRGWQECDDGNTNDHDGCSSTCKNEPCNVSCLCDGWVLPWVNNSCSSVCGDNFTRGSELCDDGNLQNDDFCDQNCTVIFYGPEYDYVLMTSSMSTYPALALFVLGFRIVGLQAMNVIQCLQLLLYSQQINTFDMSFNVHGYSDPTYFPLNIPDQNYMLNRFNFMYLLMMGLFLIGAAMELYQKAKTNKNQIVNDFIAPIKNFYDDKTVKQKSESASEDTNSDDVDDFTVHYKGNDQQKTKKIINIIDSNGEKSHINQIAKKPSLISSGSVMFRQIFFDFVVNCQYIFVYSFVIQIMNESVASFLNFSTMIVVASTLFVLMLIFLTISVENPSFGENQLKFFEDKAKNYWFLVIFERFLFSVLLALSTQYQFCTFIILGLKLVVIFIHGYLDLYFEKIQKCRSIITHVLHFLLIMLFLLNKFYFEPMRLFLQITPKFISILYAVFVGIVLLISLVFYVREIIKKCQADFRDSQKQTDSEQVSEDNNHGKAVFDVQKEYSIDDHIEQLDRQTINTKHNVFDDLKTLTYIAKSNQPSESQSPIKFSPKSKKIISTNYMNYLNVTKSSYHSDSTSKSKESYKTHRRNNLKLKQSNIFEQESDVSDEGIIKPTHKSRKSNFALQSEKSNQEVYKFEEELKRASIDNCLYLNDPDNVQNQPPKKGKGVAKSIRRIGLKNRKNKKSNEAIEQKKSANIEDKEENSANELIKDETFGGNYSTVTHLFHEPRKPQKKRTYAHKRNRHEKKEDKARSSENANASNISYEKTQNFDNFDGVSVVFDKN